MSGPGSSVEARDDSTADAATGGSGEHHPVRILLVEDNTSVRVGVTSAMRSEGYSVRGLADGSEVAVALQTFRPDLVVIDVYLPDGDDGFVLAERVRAVASIPIVFLTAADTIEDRLRGFALGADDYIVKPFSTAELLARIRAVLRRTGRLSSTTVQVRDLVVDEATHTVIRSGERVELTPTEFELLRALVRTPGRLLSKAQILSQVWGFDAYDPNLVEVYISALRRKLEAHGPRLIFTERGKGYVIYE
jgi:two-component system, OmpR family, response regulator